MWVTPFPGWDPELYINGEKERSRNTHLSFSASGPYFHRELDSPFLLQVALHFSSCIYFILYVVGLHPCQATVRVWSEDNMWELVHLFYHEGPIDQAHAIRLEPWLGCRMSPPEGACVEGLVPDWWCYLGCFRNFRKWCLTGRSRSLGMSLRTVSCP